MSTKRCRCGHHPLAHRGPATECYGWVPTGLNALGHKQHRRCECPTYRRSAVSRWRAYWTGTEERAWADAL